MTLEELAQENPQVPLDALYYTHTHRNFMTDQRLMELWGDGTQFGMNTEMVGALNNAFREVAMRFAVKVMEIEHQEAYNDGWSDGVNSVRSGVLGD